MKREGKRRSGGPAIANPVPGRSPWAIGSPADLQADAATPTPTPTATGRLAWKTKHKPLRHKTVLTVAMLPLAFRSGRSCFSR